MELGKSWGKGSCCICMWNGCPEASPWGAHWDALLAPCNICAGGPCVFGKPACALVCGVAGAERGGVPNPEAHAECEELAWLSVRWRARCAGDIMGIRPASSISRTPPMPAKCP